MKRAVVLVSVAVVMSGLLHVGTIRKKEDPILKTQTDPISYQKKEEEMKEGPKGAPTPSFNLYPKARFMSDPAVGEIKEEPSPAPSGTESITEVPLSSEDESEDWWSDEAENTEEDAQTVS